LQELSAKGDALERLSELVDFEMETSNNPGLASGYDGGDGDTQR